MQYFGFSMVWGLVKAVERIVCLFVALWLLLVFSVRDGGWAAAGVRPPFGSDLH